MACTFCCVAKVHYGLFNVSISIVVEGEGFALSVSEFLDIVAIYMQFSNHLVGRWLNHI